ncbi:hypothetical protein [Ohtaekwangia sp.]|uniref:hypothetical protein n=1 Tax=Ohtaekwangia sp. TaxID=2066019 RepID=UPI002FDD3E66
MLLPSIYQRFGPIKQNQKAIQRLKDIQAGKIQVTDFDKRFYTHELNEYQRFKELKVADDVYDGRYYEHAHAAALEEYGINERIETIYHPSTEPTVNEELMEINNLRSWIEDAKAKGKYIEQ